MATTKKNKYNLTDASNMMKALSSGDKSKQVDANGDGKTNLSDVSTMMKYAAGWSPEAAEDPYRGKEVAPGQYDDSQSYLLGKVVNRDPFEFSGTDSPLYKAYAKTYKREGDLSAKDTLSKVSSRTGGVPSSYAVTATAAQQNQYAGALADKIPELYQMEYNQYATDAERDRADLNTLLSVKNNDLAYAGTMAEYGDYSGLEGLGIDLSKLESDEALSKAVNIYQITGDTSLLKALGYDTSYLDKQNSRQDAEYWMSLYQKTGDTRYLQMIDPDIDLSKIMQDRKLSEAANMASIGDYSGYEALGYDTSYAKAAQNKSLYSGSSGSGSIAGYSSGEQSAMETKITMGPLYWDDSVKKYCQSVYGMEPIDLYYMYSAYDQKGNSTGVSYYDVVSSSLTAIGSPIKIASPEEWAKYSVDYRNRVLKRWGATSYDDFVRKVAYKYL